MDQFITAIEKSMPDAQARALATFIERSESDGYQLSSQLSGTGSRIYSVPADATDPAQYNTAIASAIADIHALYTGLDSVSATAKAIEAINRSELDRLQSEVDRLEGVLGHVSALVPTSATYTHVLRKSFNTNDCDRNYIPTDMPKLSVDPQTACLTRPSALSVSRLFSADKNLMCKVSVEALLGTSDEGRHPIEEAVDGDHSSFWQEIIHASSPIVANKDAVPWLKNTNYSGGAAARVRFDFDALTPISEISIKPLADHPIEVLAISWSTDTLESKDQPGIIDVGGNFSSWPQAQWQQTIQGTVTVTNPLEGQDTTKCLKMVFSGLSGDRCILKRSVSGLKAGATYSFSFRARSSSGKGQVTAQITSNQSKTILFRHTPEVSKKWTLYTYLITMPTSISDVPNLELAFFDRETLWFDDLQINANSMSIVPDAAIGSTGSIVIPLVHDLGKPVMCRTLWLTLGQRNYTLEHYSTAKSQYETSKLWTSVLENNNSNEWINMTSNWRREEDSLPQIQNGSISEAAVRLGGKIKSMLAGLMRMSGIGYDKVVSMTRYEYVIGAWEIDLRYRDYAPNGYWLSKPLGIQGEIRQMTVVPSMGPLESDKIKFYLLPQTDTPVDIEGAYCFDNDWTVYFRSSTENSRMPSMVEVTDPNVITLQPRSPRTASVRGSIADGKEVYHGTDRQNRIQLGAHPYFDADAAWAIQTTVTAEVTGGNYNILNRYDPNAIVQTYVDDYGVIRTTGGYRPVGVTLHLNDGQVVPPDVIGRIPYTKFRIQQNEILREITDDTTLTARKDSVTASGTETTEQTTRRVRVFKTSKPICYIAGLGPRVSIYAHNVSSPSSGDVLLDPSKYTIRWERQVANLISPGNSLEPKSVNYSDTIEIVADPLYDSVNYEFRAFYRTEVSAAPSVDDDDYTYLDESGSAQVQDLADLALQAYPVTRNVTDYLTGRTPALKRAVLDRTSPNYYPVYEYYVDSNGSVIFANDLFEYGDSPARIEVEYLTLDINPRILVSYESPDVGSSTCSTPTLYDYTILVNARS